VAGKIPQKLKKYSPPRAQKTQREILVQTGKRLPGLWERKTSFRASGARPGIQKPKYQNSGLGLDRDPKFAGLMNLFLIYYLCALRVLCGEYLNGFL
jgi:hypothetical protein